MRKPAFTSLPASDAGLSLYRRRWTAWFALPFGIVMCLCGIWFLLMAIHVVHGPIGMAVGALVLLGTLGLGISICRGALLALRSDGPALVIDQRGISYVSQGASHFIDWHEVERISSNQGDGNELGIWFKPGARGASGAGVARMFKRALLGADLTIPLGGLVYQPRMLADTLTRLHQNAQPS